MRENYITNEQLPVIKLQGIFIKGPKKAADWPVNMFPLTWGDFFPVNSFWRMLPFDSCLWHKNDCPINSFLSHISENPIYSHTTETLTHNTVIVSGRKI